MDEVGDGVEVGIIDTSDGNEQAWDVFPELYLRAVKRLPAGAFVGDVEGNVRTVLPGEELRHDIEAHEHFFGEPGRRLFHYLELDRNSILNAVDREFVVGH